MRLKIWHKMIIGITIPSLIAVLGGVLTYGYINDVKSRQGFMRISDNLNEQVLEIRRNEKNFLHYRNDDSLKGLNRAISAFNVSAGKISPKIAREIGSREFSTVKELLGEYSGTIKELNESFRSETAVAEKVRAKGAMLERLVAEKKHAKELSTDFVLRLRLLEKNYMFYRDRNSYTALDKGLLQIKNMMPFCYDCVPYIESVHELFTKYGKSDLLMAGLQKAGDSLEQVTGEIASRERQKITAFITNTQKLLLAALILLFLLGPYFVYRTASYIVAPIKRLADITQKISEGDITQRALLKEHDETHSLAVSFNTMLDNLQETQQSLKNSMELLREKQAQLVESEKRASMGFLVAGVAHEINNPLNNISLRAELIKEGLNDLPAEKTVEYIDDIIMQSQRAHKIVDNLLDFARARKSSGMEKQDITVIVKDSFKLVENQLKVSNIRLERDIPDIAYYINGNRSKIEQVLISIITNAIQAMDEAGTLTVSVRPDNEKKNILVKISDTGKGIPESNLKNIFEPFFTTKPPGKGTGLGLAVSHTLITEHNGKIEVESSQGSGTSFTIKLPLLENNA